MSRKCTRWLATLLLAGPLSNALAETPTTAENALQRLLQQPRLGCAAQERLPGWRWLAPLFRAPGVAGLAQRLYLRTAARRCRSTGRAPIR